MKSTMPGKPANPTYHPTYKIMVVTAITALKERSGSSRQAILKYIMANYNVGTEATKINARIKTALKAGVEVGTLKQTKGSGASGSFRIGEKKVKPKSTAKKAAKDSKSESPKKSVARKLNFPAEIAAKPKSPAKKMTTKPKASKKATAKKNATKE